MQTYLVGGAVRDQLLGIASQDKDYVVVGATVESMLAQDYRQVGSDFPVFLHPQTQCEYALARTERKSGSGYKGFQVAFGPEVTLEEDLYRRDLSINAMAMDDDGKVIDPYGGEDDLRNRWIRHVSPHFREDPLRVLRLARFAAKLKSLDFRIAPETQVFLQEMVNSGELSDLTPERVWVETEKALKTDHPATYFLTLKNCGALKVLFPEVDALFGLGQPRKWHPEIDVGVHVMQVLQSACELSDDPVIRFAALCHDFGKGNTDKAILPSHRGHELRSVDLLKGFYQRYPVPSSYKVVADRVAEFHGYVHKISEMKPSTIIKFLNKLKAWQQPQLFQKFLLACKADSRGRTGFEQAEFPQAKVLIDIVNAAKGFRLSQTDRLGLRGPEIGAALDRKRATLSKSFKKKRIHKYALIADTKVPIPIANQSTASSFCNSLSTCKPPASVITGIESKKEKRADAWRFIPNSRAAVMVMPERDVPGIKASAWAQPIMATSLHLISCKTRERFPLLSAHHRRSPKPIVVAAITKVERKFASM